MKVRHYSFLSYGVWGTNPGHIRPRELGAEMLRRGIRVSYVVDDYPENHGDLGTPPGAEIVFAKSPRGAAQLFHRRRLLRDLAPDYVHIKDLNFRTFQAIAWQPGLRVVFDWDEPSLFREHNFLGRKKEEFLASWMADACTKMVVTTHRLQQYVQEHYGVSARYLPYATYISPLPDPPSPFAQPTAVYMGSMHPKWDIDLMMDAIHLLAEEGFKPHFAFVGSDANGNWREVARTQGLDNIEFLGYRPDAEMWSYVRNAHILLFPIRPTLVNETRCPSKTLVYAQSLRPIITSPVGEVQQMLGNKGVYVDPTPQSMANAIRQYMQTNASPDIHYGMERYNYSDRVDELLALLEA